MNCWSSALGAVIGALACMPALAQSPVDGELAVPWVQASGQHVEGFDVAVSANAALSLRLMGSTETLVTFSAAPVPGAGGAGQVTLTVSGLVPVTPYYVFVDDYTSPQMATSSATGEVTFAQVVDSSHLIMVQNQPGTITIDAETCPDGWSCLPAAGPFTSVTAPAGATIADNIQVVVPDIVVDLNGSTVQPADAHGVLIAAGRVTLRNGSVDGGSSCVLSQGTADVVVENLVCTNSGRTGGIVFATSTRPTVRNSTATTNAALSIGVVGCSDAVVDGNTVSDSFAGIQIEQVAGLTLSNNTSSLNRKYGVLITTSSNVSLTGNSVSGNLRPAGDSVSGPGTTLGPSASGIAITASTNVTSSGDVVNDNEGHGVSISATEGVDWSATSITNNDRDGFRVQGSTDVTLRGPATVITGNLGNGAYFDENTTATVGPDVDARGNATEPGTTDIAASPGSITTIGPVLCDSSSSVGCGDDLGVPSITIDSVTESVLLGEEVQVSLTLVDLDDATLDLQVAWGDGAVDALSASPGTLLLSHVYTTNGVFEVRLTATDAAGDEATATTRVEVRARPADVAEAVVADVRDQVVPSLPFGRRAPIRSALNQAERRLRRAQQAESNGNLNRALRRTNRAARSVRRASRRLNRFRTCPGGPFCVQPAVQRSGTVLLSLTERQIDAAARDLCARGAVGDCPPEVQLGCASPSTADYSPCDDGNPATFDSVCIAGTCVGITDTDGDGVEDLNDCFVGRRVLSTSLLGALVLVDNEADFDAIALDGLTRLVSVVHSSGAVVTFEWQCVEPLVLNDITVERFTSAEGGFQAVAGLGLQSSSFKDMLYPTGLAGVPDAVCVADIPIEKLGVEQHRKTRTSDCSGPDEQLIPCVASCDGDCGQPACLIEDGAIRVTGLQHTSFCTCTNDPLVAGPMCECPAYECPFTEDEDGDGYSICRGDCQDDPNAGFGWFCAPVQAEDCDTGYTTPDGEFSFSPLELQQCAVCVHPGAKELCDGNDNNCNWSDNLGQDLDGCLATYDGPEISALDCLFLVTSGNLGELDAEDVPDSGNECAPNVCLGGNILPQFADGKACTLDVFGTSVGGTCLAGQCVRPPASWPPGSELTAQVAVDGSIALNWTDASANSGVVYELSMENLDLLAPPEVLLVSSATTGTVATPPQWDLLRFRVRTGNGTGQFTLDGPTLDVVVGFNAPAFNQDLEFTGTTQSAVSVSWKKAAEDEEIDHYQVSLNYPNGDVAVSPKLYGNTTTSFTFADGIVPNEDYAVSVVAYNRLNCQQYEAPCENSAEITDVATTPAPTTPNWPSWAQLIQVGATSTTATLTWPPGAFDAASYRVTVSDVALATIVQDDIPGPFTTVDLSSLGQPPYTATVTAINAQGQSTLADTETIVLEDTDPPVWEPSDTVGGTWSPGQLLVEWDAATDDQEVVSYDVKVCTDAACSSQPVCSGTVLAEPLELTCPADQATTYYLRVVATDTAGLESLPLLGTASTGAGAPGWSSEPPVVSVTDIGRTGATVNWDVVDQGTPAVAYRVQVAPADTESGADTVEDEAAGPPFLVDHLIPGTSYIATVDVKTVDGSYVLLGVSEAFTTETGPSAAFDNPSDLDLTVPTTTWAIAEFLVNGPDAPQWDVAPDLLVPEQAALVSGYVKYRDPNTGQSVPAESVLVQVHGHPRFGKTLTRADGRYDLVLNGGGEFVITFDPASSPGLEGFLPADRRVKARWAETTTSQDVVLVKTDDGEIVDFPGGLSYQVVSGPPKSDESLQRQARLFFPPGIVAFSTDEDGVKMPITGSRMVSATEYTVGSDGPDAMPADLPPQTAYTYALELTVDGAQNVEFENGEVTLTVDNFLGFPPGVFVPFASYDRESRRWIEGSRGVVLEVDGSGADLTPATKNLFFAEGGTQLELNALLLHHNEPGTSFWRITVAHFSPHDPNYPPGPPSEDEEDSPRPRIAGGGTGDGEGTSNAGESNAERCADADTCETPKPCNPTRPGSVIGCTTATLGEMLPVAGTELSLHYDSGRVPGRRFDRILRMKLTETDHPFLEKVFVKVEVAGNVYEVELDAEDNLTWEFDLWDGTDFMGRRVTGPIPVDIDITYGYQAVYRIPVDGSWASTTYWPAIGPQARTVRGKTYSFRRYVWSYDQRDMGLGGWSLSNHHMYDAVSKTLLRGDGTSSRRGGRTFMDVETTFTTPANAFWGPSDWKYPPAVAPNGAIYFSANNRILRLQEGIVAVVAGNGVAGFANGVGTAARFDGPQGVAMLSPDELVVVDSGNCMLRKLTLVGDAWTSSTLAGSLPSGACVSGENDAIAPIGSIRVGLGGELYFASSDDTIRVLSPGGQLRVVAGGAEPEAEPSATGLDLSLAGIGSFDVHPDGGLVIADSGNGKLWKVETTGTASLVAGTGAPDGDGYTDQVKASEANIGFVRDLQVLRDGSVVFLEAQTWVVRIVYPTGGIATLLGDGTTCAALNEELCDLSFFVKPSPYQFIARNPKGELLLGGASYPTSNIPLYSMETLRSAARAGTAGEQLVVDGGFVHGFDAAGRHKRTYHRYTGEVAWSFDYDTEGRVIAMTSGIDNDFAIAYSEDGASIETSQGHTTSLTYTADGQKWLESAELWGSAPYTYTALYKAGDENAGLLESFQKPAMGAKSFTYGPFGRFQQEESAEGLTQSVAFDEETQTHMFTGADGEVTEFQLSGDVGGQTVLMSLAPDDRVTTIQVSNDGAQRCMPNGERSKAQTKPDPVWGDSARYVVSSSRSRALSCDDADPAIKGVDVDVERTTSVGAVGFAQSSIENKRTETGIIDTTPRLWIDRREPSPVPGFALRSTRIDPTGLATTRYLDVHERTRREEVPGYLPMTYALDAANGYPLSMQSGSGENASRFVLSYEGADAGEPSSGNGRITQMQWLLGDTALQTLAFPTHTASGLPTEIVRNDGAAVELGYDAADRVTSIELPGSGGLLHTWAFDADGRLDYYTPAANEVGDINAFTVDYHYDSVNGRLERITQPNGAGDIEQLFAYAIGDNLGGYYSTCPDNGYAPVGQWFLMVDGEMEVGRCFDPAGRPETLWRERDGQEIRVQRSYFANRLSREDWFLSGLALGSVLYDFDDYDRIQTLQYGTGVVSHSYDLDGRLLSAGKVAYAYDPATGRLLSETVAVEGDGPDSVVHTVETSYTYIEAGQHLGKVASRTTFVGTGSSTPLWTAAYAYDDHGRIETITETRADAVPTTSWYQYDPQTSALRWVSVCEGAQATCAESTDFVLRYEYDYDLNGNRALYRTFDQMGALLVEQQFDAYDAQDRLTGESSSVPPVLYTHYQRGPLQSISAGGAVTSFEFDSQNHVTRMTSGGSAIGYVTTPAGDLAARIDGTAVTDAYVYGAALRPVTQLGEAGTLKATFVYGIAQHIPAYMTDAAGETYAFVRDHLGSPRFLVNVAAGQVVQEIEYSPYGIASYVDPATKGLQPFGFVGGIVEHETGMLTIGPRVYDPHRGRWLSKDPRTFGAGGFNAYSYGFNDPVNFVDIDGRSPVAGVCASPWGLVVCGAAAGAAAVGGAVYGLYKLFGGGGSAMAVEELSALMEEVINRLEDKTSDPLPDDGPDPRPDDRPGDDCDDDDGDGGEYCPGTGRKRKVGSRHFCVYKCSWGEELILKPLKARCGTKPRWFRKR